MLYIQFTIRLCNISPICKSISLISNQSSYVVPMNKSSSFYGQAYYQKARKQAYKKKPIYRTKRQELFDQQHELEIHRYHYNTTHTCSMMSYFGLLNEAYLQMKQQPVTKHEDYSSCVNDFISNMNKRIAYFHQQLMPKRYLTRDEYIKLGIRTAEQLRNHWLAQLNSTNAEPTELEERQERVETCNLCPLFIEQFEFNFNRCLSVVIKSCEYWEQLNGYQKIRKYRWHIEQNLRVLERQLLTKCEYAHNKNSTAEISSS